MPSTSSGRSARNGGEAALAGDVQLDQLLHVYRHNRGVRLTPFQNMALIAPASGPEDVQRHTRVAAVGEGARRVHVRDARSRGDREAGGHPLRSEHAGHLGDVGALAAEHVSHLLRALREVDDPLRRDGSGHRGLA